MSCIGALRKETLRWVAAPLMVAVLVVGQLVPLASASAYSETTAHEAAAVAMSPQEQADEEREGESELPWLFAVFFITWAVFFGYVFFMSRRQREMRREMEALRRALQERESQGPSRVESGSQGWQD